VENSKISWTDHTFNPWVGCTKVSPGCAHCYAEALMDKRWGKAKWGKGNPRTLAADAYWKKPLAWNKRALKSGMRELVFCASLADVFDEEVPHEWRARLFDLIEATKGLAWLLLTKRPEFIKQHLREIGRERVPDNVWLGTSVEDDARACRLLYLLHQPATVHWVSAEPLLGPVDWSPYLLPNPTGGIVDWIVFGGESTQAGAPARECQLTWIRDGIAAVSFANRRRDPADQCRVHVKQLGDHATDFLHTPDGVVTFPLKLSPKGGEQDQWPEDLKIREYPGDPIST
jgi:protein gp37